MTREQEILSENLLKEFKNNEGVFNYRNYQPLWQDNSGLTRISVIRALRELGLIEEVNGTTFRLTTTGWNFTSFEEERNRRSLEIEKERERHLLELKQFQSIIETNESVKQTNEFIKINSRAQNALTRSSIIVAAASALFAFGAMFATMRDRTSDELQQIREQMERESRVQNRIVFSLENINSSIKDSISRETPQP